MGWEELVLEMGVNTWIIGSVWSCGTGEGGRGILGETNWAIRSSDFLDMGSCPRWDSSCWRIFDAFMRCAGVGAGMLDDNALDEPGSVTGTSGWSEGGHCWASDGACPFSKLDATDAIFSLMFWSKHLLSPSPLGEVLTTPSGGGKRLYSWVLSAN